MTMTFEKKGKELILCYSPEGGTDWLFSRINKGEEIGLKHTFFVTKELLRESEDEETSCFAIGDIGKKYTQIYSNVIGTKHWFYFSNEITLNYKFFVAYRNISILKKIDGIIDSDFYIGGKWEEQNGISLECYKLLLKQFPKTAELDKYANYRIANCIKEFLPEVDKYKDVYEQFINRNGEISKPITSKANLEIEIAQFGIVYDELKTMLKAAEGTDEKTWQNKIKDILQFIYPQYILFTREIKFKGIDKHDKQPDFIMVDANGFIDILEIKKPDVRILTEKASYRNNYVPTRDFSGGIQQIEKYIYCLTSEEKSRLQVVEKLKAFLPISVTPCVLNPRGIFLAGRSDEFNEQQLKDFELIRRQYKNVTDIMTYDDLMKRLENILTSLKSRLQNGD